jgi:hypothetical protein
MHRLTEQEAARARPLIIRLAKESGIVTQNVDDDTAIETLREVCTATLPQPAERPAIVEPARQFAALPINDAQATRIAVIRSGFTLLNETVVAACKPGRYLSLVSTALEEACMWCVKSITHEPL